MRKISLTVLLVLENVIASDIVHAVSYLHSRDTLHRDIKPVNVLMSISHYKSYKPIFCKLSDIGESKTYVYTD